MKAAKAAMKCKAAKAMKIGRPRKCSKIKKAMKAVECLKETKWKLAKAANEGQELGMWLDLWLDEIRTLGATLASASKEQVETRGATITDSEEQVETHSEDWWKRDLPEWVFEEAMATAQKNNLDEGIVQPSGVLPGHVKLCDDQSVEKGCYVIKDPQASGRDAADNCHNCARDEALCRCCRCGYAMCER